MQELTLKHPKRQPQILLYIRSSSALHRYDHDLPHNALRLDQSGTCFPDYLLY